MFIKSLEIDSKEGIIRSIPFHAGLNLIIDETHNQPKETGNNIGKTTVLMLIDFCLKSNYSPKDIYTDPENKKGEYALVKNFLISKEVCIRLTLVENLNDQSSKKVVIEKNFLSRKKQIRKINGVQKTIDGFEEEMTNILVPNHYGKKPTFSQIISNNIRYKETSINNTLKTLNNFTRDDEYETLHLFLLGCNFEKGALKQSVLSKIRLEKNFKNRLESENTRTAYETSLALLEEEIKELNIKKESIYINPNFNDDLCLLNETKYKINYSTSKIRKLQLRKDLIQDAVNDIKKGKVDIDTNELIKLYAEVGAKIDKISKSFESLLIFHNSMIKEKVMFISKELPELEKAMEIEKDNLSHLFIKEKELSKKINESSNTNELEIIISNLNNKYREKGEFDTIIHQIKKTEKNIKEFSEEINRIAQDLFSPEFEKHVQNQINKFNKYFSEISQELYNEKYALKYDIKIDKKTGQKIYKFSSFNTNLSSGKKQGEIVCFDIAYLLFSSDENIPCFNFLLNDKKELMHGNQLIKISNLVEKNKSKIQYISSILKDKLPQEMEDEKNFVLKLSQQDKLFRIE